MSFLFKKKMVLIYCILLSSLSPVSIYYSHLSNSFASDVSNVGLVLGSLLRYWYSSCFPVSRWVMDYALLLKYIFPSKILGVYVLLVVLICKWYIIGLLDTFYHFLTILLFFIIIFMFDYIPASFVAKFTTIIRNTIEFLDYWCSNIISTPNFNHHWR